jgi:hypothetical protein
LEACREETDGGKDDEKDYKNRRSQRLNVEPNLDAKFAFDPSGM